MAVWVPEVKQPSAGRRWPTRALSVLGDVLWRTDAFLDLLDETKCSRRRATVPKGLGVLRNPMGAPFMTRVKIMNTPVQWFQSFSMVSMTGEKKHH